MNWPQVRYFLIIKTVFLLLMDDRMTTLFQTDLPCPSKEGDSILGRVYRSMKKTLMRPRVKAEDIDAFFDGPLARAIQERESGYVNRLVRVGAVALKHFYYPPHVSGILDTSIS